jgi:hypothetical protein
VSAINEPDIPYGWDGQAASGKFDEARAAGVVGKYVVIGVTYVDAIGTEEERFQMYGVIENASAAGIKVSLRGTHEGRSWTMPPDLRGLSPAKPCRYTLAETNEVVENPDFVAIWTVAKPRRGQAVPTAS